MNTLKEDCVKIHVQPVLWNNHHTHNGMPFHSIFENTLAIVQ